MMITILLLVLIYLAFISLGLPDSLVGVAWPAIRAQWNLPLDYAGLVQIPIVGSTIASSLLSGYIIKKFGTGRVTFISCLMTGLALLGFSFAPSIGWLLLLGIPLGLGGGSVDAALNNYVALHFKAHHMNWLHSFWGIGATVGPLIMSGALSQDANWRLGYLTIALIQLSLAIVLMISLPLWKKHREQPGYNVEVEAEQNSEKPLNMLQVFKMKGIVYAIATFMFYVSAEMSVGLWGSSYLVESKNIGVGLAASWVALYYGGITAGRFLSGFISFKLNNVQMIRLGIGVSLTGILMLILPLPGIFNMIALILTGLGFSPIFPAMIHETPNRFGSQNSQTVIGYQMGFGYMGSAVLPPLFGVILDTAGMVFFPFLILMSILIVLFCSEKLT